jgi:hypothetical protein
MDATTAVVDIQAVQPAQKSNLSELYKFALDQLQCLLNIYSHTGIPHYWEEAKVQQHACEELSQRMLSHKENKF